MPHNDQRSRKIGKLGLILENQHHSDHSIFDDVIPESPNGNSDKRCTVTSYMLCARETTSTK